MSYHQAEYDEPLLNQFRSGSTYRVDTLEHTSDLGIPQKIQRNDLNIPDIAEYDVVRHFTRLSQMNFGVDVGFYPLGSCTMKFNPKFADQIASFSEFRDSHPLAPEEFVQGNLRIVYELQEYLKELSDMDFVSVQPLAGAHGEFSGILVARKYFQDTNQPERTEVVIPDSAHGTNPASAAMGGFNVVEIPSDGDGKVNLKALEAALSKKTAVFMITNPNTLGIFDDQIEKIAEMVHSVGAVLYYDGANFNAILGRTSPGRMGFDIVHFNLHKTFATPHGGGGPGAGPIAVKSRFREYLPVPIVGLKDGKFFLDYSAKKSVGRVSGTIGSFGVLLRAWSYIRYHGADGLKENSSFAVLNTNYLKKKVENRFDVPFYKLKKHEFVLSTANTGRRATDVAKYVLDHGMHPPTVYFPMLVHESMMIEPTESVSRQDLDRYADVLISAVDESPERLKERPLNTPVTRIDEVKAARDLKVRW